MISKSVKNFVYHLRKHYIVTSVALIITICFISALIYEDTTRAPSELNIPYAFAPVNDHNSGYDTFGFNGTTYPVKFNETGTGFAAVFEMMQGPPATLTSAGFNILAFGISIVCKTVSSPYSNVTFYVSGASLTIGNYTTGNYAMQETVKGGIFFIFQPEPFGNYDPITCVDKVGMNYTAQYSVTIVPILHFSFIHYELKSFTLNYETTYPWYHINAIPF